jgi:hypothetical protein
MLQAALQVLLLLLHLGSMLLHRACGSWLRSLSRCTGLEQQQQQQ